MYFTRRKRDHYGKKNLVTQIIIIPLQKFLPSIISCKHTTILFLNGISPSPLLYPSLPNRFLVLGVSFFIISLVHDPNQKTFSSLSEVDINVTSSSVPTNICIHLKISTDMHFRYIKSKNFRSLYMKCHTVFGD